MRPPWCLTTLLLLALSGCVATVRGEARAAVSHQQLRLKQDQIAWSSGEEGVLLDVDDGELDRADAGERMSQGQDDHMLGGARRWPLRPVPPVPTGLRCPGPPCPAAANWNLTLEPSFGPNNNAQQSPTVVTISGDVRLLPRHSEVRHCKREVESRRNLSGCIVASLSGRNGNGAFTTLAWIAPKGPTSLAEALALLHQALS